MGLFCSFYIVLKKAGTDRNQYLDDPLSRKTSGCLRVNLGVEWHPEFHLQRMMSMHPSETAVARYLPVVQYE